MATTPKNDAAVPTFGEGADTFDSGNRKEKSELTGQPHMIYKVTFDRGASGYSRATLEAVDKQNKPFFYVDGSTGVYAQVVSHLRSKGLITGDVTKPDEGEYDIRLVVPKGLKYREYEGPDGRPTGTYSFA